MLVKILTGMNVPDKTGNVIPTAPGDIVDVPTRFGHQQISHGRAVPSETDWVQLETPEADKNASLKKR